MKQLVVTADDFGAALEVNEAVERAHRNGILSAASLMVTAPAAEDAIRRARALPALKVGLHLVLIEGRPCLPARRVPDLVGESGAFRSDMLRLAVDIAMRAGVRRQAAAEIEAQFEAFHASGLTLDHCNAHKHFHLHPVIGDLIVKIGRRFGLGSVRVPVEPHSTLNRLEPSGRRIGEWFMRGWSRLVRQKMRAAGIAAPDQVFGLAWSGAMTRTRLLWLLRHLPEGLTEIYLHPAVRGGFPGSVADYRYQDELDALLAPEAIAAVKDIPLGGFSDFATGAGARAGVVRRIPAAARKGSRP